VSPIPSNRYDEAIFAIGIIKKVTGEKRQGGGIHPPGRPRVNFERLDSVHAMFQELGLPTFNTLMHNAKHKFSMNGCTNHLVMLVNDICTARY
jgi:hypothetical protein